MERRRRVTAARSFSPTRSFRASARRHAASSRASEPSRAERGMRIPETSSMGVLSDLRAERRSSRKSICPNCGRIWDKLWQLLLFGARAVRAGARRARGGAPGDEAAPPRPGEVEAPRTRRPRRAPRRRRRGPAGSRAASVAGSNWLTRRPPRATCARSGSAGPDTTKRRSKALSSASAPFAPPSAPARRGSSTPAALPPAEATRRRARSRSIPHVRSSAHHVPGACQAREVEDHDAGEPVRPEEHLAGLARELRAVPQQARDHVRAAPRRARPGRGGPPPVRRRASRARARTARTRGRASA